MPPIKTIRHCRWWTPAGFHGEAFQGNRQWPQPRHTRDTLPARPSNLGHNHRILFFSCMESQGIFPSCCTHLAICTKALLFPAQTERHRKALTCINATQSGNSGWGTYFAVHQASGCKNDPKQKPKVPIHWDSSRTGTTEGLCMGNQNQCLYFEEVR